MLHYAKVLNNVVNNLIEIYSLLPGQTTNIHSVFLRCYFDFYAFYETELG